ncbi:LysM peptidoglycan-binding domain-containing protein [Priestia flexa]|jgi:LysM domain|uniref:Cell division protein n=2 Tax=Priestia TaxID=2800373 RepID=A0A0V8JQ10_9BACI|nr:MULTISPECIES: LysM peptidoglycan-binding domain-containing protein [Bacillaceae]AQX54189.1 cell division protein [Priestia flexa]KSU88957.1 cell division protein [Priestia veravalensis]KZB91549.1 cell division protein [Bacillus sp. VT 712]MBN8251634.1 LysM peptidoglycan-binding domain-containing protein [Priestia flexa]MBN8434948.1 LysM peptidoglycan-binding domain-containing protein [Priestia flexa]
MRPLIESIKHYTTFFVVIAALTYVLTLLLGADRVELEKYTTVTIAKGDTIWELSQEYSKHHNLSPNEFVEWVQNMNELTVPSTQSLSPGDQLYIPVLKSDLASDHQIAFDK